MSNQGTIVQIIGSVIGAMAKPGDLVKAAAMNVADESVKFSKIRSTKYIEYI
jgi:hypothetical protein